MKGITISAGGYIQFTPEGNVMEGSVYKEWIKIWNADLPRAYTTDFEVYGAAAQHPEDTEVNIFIAIK
jgi:predicted transcriptional regulator YdeE